jgi:hypothetical protein
MKGQEYPVFKSVKRRKICLEEIPEEPNRTNEEKEIINAIEDRILMMIEIYRYRKDLIVEALQHIIDKFTDGYYM